MAIPGETTVKRAIANLLRDELAYCRSLLEFGVGLPDSAVINQRRLKADTVTVVMGLYTKACLSYRAILHLCEVGLDRSAAPVNRSLFETLLNLTFLLRRRVSLRRFGFSAGKIRPTKTPVNLHGRKLDTEFRTDLYCAFCTLRDQKMVGQWPITPGLKRTGKDAHKRLSALPQPHIAAVGADWEKALAKANTCTGLSVADYAASLGREFYMLYRSVYAFDSQSVHQSDSLAYLDIDDAATNISPRWHTSPEQVRTTLQMASLMFVGCMRELNMRLRFGRDVADRISGFATALNGWSKAE